MNEDATIVSRRKQLLETLGRLLFGVTLVFVMGVLIAGWGGDRLVRRRLAAIAARGDPLTLRTSVLASGERDAMPLYQQAESSLRLTKEARAQLKSDFRGLPLPESVLRDNRVALDLTRRASRRVRCIYPPDPTLPGYPQSDDGRLRVLCRLLRDAALREAARGDTEAALADLRGVAGITVHAAGTPGVLGLLRHIEFRALTEQAAGEMLQTLHPDPSLIRQIDRIVPPIDWQRAGVEAIREERAVGLAVYDAAIFRPAGTSAASRLSGAGYEIRAFFRWDELAYLDSIDRAVQRVGEPLFRAGGAPDTPSPKTPLPFQVAPDPKLLRTVIERAIVRDRQARVAVALAAYRHRLGTYPATLGASGLNVDIRDPYAAGTFRYRSEGERYRLWSVGANRKNDGGAHRKPQDDIVWPIPQD